MNVSLQCHAQIIYDREVLDIHEDLAEGRVAVLGFADQHKVEVPAPDGGVHARDSIKAARDFGNLEKIAFGAAEFVPCGRKQLITNCARVEDGKNSTAIALNIKTAEAKRAITRPTVI
ncbi:hypothetical protein [uncultured Tateyamaria sp.]|uniref:hypothetical protein n=1 Tax=uncultured Tateyamaria sp. TaxID=455651 RepID=UPI002606D15A|nr:hypothetical protein [uncultured Tateyamaria sp.]